MGGWKLSVADGSGGDRDARSGSGWNPKLRAGFTLVEVSVTVVLLVLVAGTVSLSLRGNLQASRSELAYEQLQLVDRQTRVLAKRSGRSVELQFDVAGNRIVRSEANRTPSVLESGVSMREVLGSKTGMGQKRGRQVGFTTVEFRGDGSGSSYAVCLPVGRERSEWIVFAGGSGQSLRTNDEREVERLLGW